jgi:hypothetical protein
MVLPKWSAKLEFLVIVTDDKGMTSFGITFTGPLAGTPSYTLA